jgi:hypothetical protein
MASSAKSKRRTRRAAINTEIHQLLEVSNWECGSGVREPELGGGRSKLSSRCENAQIIRRFPDRTDGIKRTALMPRFVEAEDRGQSSPLPARREEFVDDDTPARVFDT